LKNPSELRIALPSGAATTALVYAGRGETTLILGHGAGAGQRSAFMVEFARALAALGVDIVTFNFLYTEQRRRIPERAPALEACFRAVVDAVLVELGQGRPLFIGGKSMGGRIATQIAAADPELPVMGLVLLGYPLHPPGRPAQRRDAHLPSIRQPVLIVQGSRDMFGTPPELESAMLRMTPRPTLHVVQGGDHSFKVPQRSAQAAVHDDIQRTIAEWIQRVSTSDRGPRRSP
jgi:predicted alpha/beta-hydrolase family hydrolase